MKKVLIVEDNESETEALVKVVRNIDSGIQIITTDNLGNAFQNAIQHNISLFIVDIVLNPKERMDASGLELIESLRKLPQYKYVPVVFVTSLDDPRLYAYEGLHCYQYIQKPLLYSEVEKVIKDALGFSEIMESDIPLKIKQDGMVYVIPKKDIIYAFSRVSKMTIVTTKESFHIFYLTCGKLMNMLQEEYFMQCNRNTIINSRYITAVDQRNDLIELAGCTERVKIGKNFRKDFLKGFI